MQQISEAQDFFNEQSEILRQKLAASEGELRKARERAGTAGGPADRGARAPERVQRGAVARAHRPRRAGAAHGVPPADARRQGWTRGHAGADRARGQARRPHRQVQAGQRAHQGDRQSDRTPAQGDRRIRLVHGGIDGRRRGQRGRHGSRGRAGCPGGAAGPRSGAHQGRRRLQEAGGVPRQPELRSRQARAAGEAGRGDVPVVRALCRAVAPLERRRAEQAAAAPHHRGCAAAARGRRSQEGPHPVLRAPGRAAC